MGNIDNVVEDIKNAVIKASSSYKNHQIQAIGNAIRYSDNENASWVLECLLENERIARNTKRPLCDDTGIPHVYIELGSKRHIPSGFLEDICKGISEGLLELPGRPMGVCGDELDRIGQNKGLYDDPSKVKPSNFLIDNIHGDDLKVHLLFLGGGPEIRANTYRIFHRGDYKIVIDEVINWLSSSLKELGCTPAIPAIGIGRTHFEANSLMIKSMIYGDLTKQSETEKYITKSLNNLNIGPLGLGGNTTVLGSFLKVGHQRASGVRIAAVRPCCCVEPRYWTVVF